MKRIIISTIALAILGLGTAACDMDSQAAKDHPVSQKGNGPQSKDKGQQSQKAKEDKGDNDGATPQTAKAAPKMTPGQEQAVGSAQDYLEYTAFSKQGLIDQLKFEDFKVADATWAVNHIKVDWNVQAAKSAKDYLDQGHFSRTALIEQLEFEDFTPAQATFGVNKAGL